MGGNSNNAGVQSVGIGASYGSEKNRGCNTILSESEPQCTRFGEKFGLGLWAHYNTRLLALHQANPFLIVRFDLGEAAYRRSVAAVLDRLGLEAPARMAFFDPDLRHHETASRSQLPEQVACLYQSLCGIALDPGCGQP
jgi:hypothetical protein